MCRDVKDEEIRTYAIRQPRTGVIAFVTHFDNAIFLDTFRLVAEITGSVKYMYVLTSQA